MQDWEKEGEGMREELNEWITIRAAFISSSRDLQWMTDWTTYRDWRPGNQDKTDKCRQNELFHTGNSGCWLQSAVEGFKVVSHVLHIHFSLMVCLSQWSLNLILHALDPRVLFFAYFECLSLSHSSVLFRSRETNEHSCLLSLLSGDWMLVVSPLLVIEEQMRAVWSSFAVCSTFLPCIIMIILCRANQTMSQRTNSHNEEEAEKRSAWCPSFPSLISWILPPVSLPSLSFSLLCIHHVLFPSPLLLLRNRFDADAPLD